MTGMPDLAAYDAVLFDLDGVLTPTVDLHMQAWQHLFESFFDEAGVTEPYTTADYFEHVDGKKRYDGVASVLASRGVERPFGDPSDPPTADTVCGIGNRKNAVFERLLRDEGIQPYPGSLRLLDALRERGSRLAVVSSSKNAVEVLAVAGIADRFEVVMDGVIAERESLASKPAPDVFVEAARMLGIEPSRSAAVEDATSGVRSAASGGFGLVLGVDRGAGESALRDAGAHVVVSDLADVIAGLAHRAD